jgi:hypothetical protein
MALPQGFNEFEFLQDLIRKWQNRVVKEEFASLGGDDFDPNITISEQALRHACTIKDSDTAEMVGLRMYLFYFLYGKARRLQPPVYGTPVSVYKENTELPSLPQIYLFFSQDEDAVPEGKNPLRAEYHINLERNIPEATWETEVNRLARKIREELATPPFVLSKGKAIYWYRQKEYKHQFKVYAYSEAEAEQLIKKMLAIQNQTYDEDCLVSSVPKRNSVNNPTGSVLRFGKRRDKPRWRPTGNVRFRWATLQDPQLPNDDLILVDTTDYFHDAIIRI